MTGRYSFKDMMFTSRAEISRIRRKLKVVSFVTLLTQKNRVNSSDVRILNLEKIKVHLESVCFGPDD